MISSSRIFVSCILVFSRWHKFLTLSLVSFFRLVSLVPRFCVSQCGRVRIQIALISNSPLVNSLSVLHFYASCCQWICRFGFSALVACLPLGSFLYFVSVSCTRELLVFSYFGPTKISSAKILCLVYSCV